MVSKDERYLVLCQSFASAFRRLKRQREIKHSHIAKALGIRYDMLWHFDKGNCLPRSADLVELARFFGVTMEQMLGLK